ncbi:hypothetical protein ACI2UK_13515 [Ralstonia nicotianae]|uniref:hypothetical protein n=1 Tax=Ralstonia pseudosolanacearum TaxID=1310165 RepID=UPI0020038C89|nr:hypothetical protein [Ralstonia pseudosolanacearum]MCK4118437.1 hypothetical protein [Ralstonia pseudosolanacearum]
MFIKLELWAEQPSADGQLPRFGSRREAYLDTHATKVQYLPINLASIVSFEPMRIITLNRPGTRENKTDPLDGVRLLLANGAQYLVIDDKDPSFEQSLAAARTADGAVYHHGPSAYMQRFAPDTVHP